MGIFWARRLFGAEIGRRLIRCLLEGTPTSESEEELKKRALLVVELLAGKRSCVDTLRGQQWRDFLNLRNAQAKADWLERANVVWRRKASGKVLVSDTFLRLVGLFEKAASLSVGAMGIPLSEYTPSKGNDKIARVNAISDLFASGLVWCPATRWAEELVEELASFPNGDHDDLVDSTSQALLRFRQGGFIRLASDAEDEQLYFKRKVAYY